MKPVRAPVLPAAEAPPFIVRRSGAIVFLAALFVRLLYLFESSDNPAFLLPIVDAATYHDLALDLSGKGRLSDSFFWQSILYPLFLTAAYIIKPSIIFVKSLQSLLAACTAFLTFRLGRRIFGPLPGLLAGLFYAFYGPAIFWEGELMSDGLGALFTPLLLLLLLKAREKASSGALLLTGAAAALAILARPTFLPFSFAAIALLAAGAGKTTGLNAGARKGLWLAAGFLFIALPAMAFRHSVTGELRIMPISGAINLYVGNHPDRCGLMNARPGRAWLWMTEEPIKAGKTTRAGLAEYYERETLKNALRAPGAFLKNIGVKTTQFFSSREIPRNHDIYHFRQWSIILSGLLWKIGPTGFPFGLLLPLALLGLYLGWGRTPLIVKVFLFLYPAAVILIFTSSRLRLPVIPVFTILAGLGTAELARRFREKGIRSLLSVLLVLAPITIVSSLPPSYCEEQADYTTEFLHGLALSASRNGAPGLAGRYYDAALTRNPDNDEIWFNYGCLFDGQGKREEAMRMWRQSLKANPSNPDALRNLYIACRTSGQVARADSLLTAMIPRFQDDAGLLLDFAQLQVRNNDFPAALKTINRVITLDPELGKAILLKKGIEQVIIENGPKGEVSNP